MKIKISNKTKFWVLFEAIHSSLDTKVVKDIVKGIDIQDTKLNFCDYSYFRSSLSVSIYTGNWSIGFGNTIRIYKNGCFFFDN